MAGFYEKDNVPSGFIKRAFLIYLCCTDSFLRKTLLCGISYRLYVLHGVGYQNGEFIGHGRSPF